MKNPIEIIINPSELGAGTRGSSLGPYAILNAARRQKNTFFSNINLVRMPDKNELLDQAVYSPFARRIDGVCDIYDGIVKQMQNSLSSSSTVFVLSGDHSSATATIAGIRNKYPNRKIGVVWVDAHADIHSPYTTPSGNMHGMSLGAALGIDNKENKRNTPKCNTIRKWNWMKNMGPDNKSLVLPNEVIYIGLRDIEEEEQKLINLLDLKVIDVNEFRQKGAVQIAKDVHQYFNEIDVLYVSFDVDSMDPDDSSYGTGTPYKDGIFVKEAKELLGEFSKSEKLKCLEIVEINPCLDSKNKMGEIVFDILENSIKNVLYRENLRVPFN